MNGLTLIENLKAAAAGGPADRDPLTGLDSRAHFLAAVRNAPAPRLLACIGIDPVVRGKPSRSRTVLRKMSARTGALMTQWLPHADYLVHWEPTLLVASFPAIATDQAFLELEELRRRFSELSFAGSSGPAHNGTLTAAVADWAEPSDTALASALLRSRSGVAGAQLRGGNCIVTVDAPFGPLIMPPLVA